MEKKIRFIDLFAGMGGIRIGLEKSASESGYETECVLTSEIKPYAVKALKDNFGSHNFYGDITRIHTEFIPDFDVLLAGFPCQPFSSGGRRKGFADTRGTLFFEIEKILEAKRPAGFILENVEGLVKHELSHPKDPIGKTLDTILKVLTDKLGYSVSWKVLDSLDFGLPQSRKRIFIVGSRDTDIDFLPFERHTNPLSKILENGLPTHKSEFTEKLLSSYNIEELYGKSIKDKRGGGNNIHSWEIGLKGRITDRQSQLLRKLFKERRKKHWAIEIGIDWMDGMPLTLDQIYSFAGIEYKVLRNDLDDLVEKGYLKFEHPKKLVTVDAAEGMFSKRIPDESKEKGYNIVTGKLSFEFNKILDPEGIAPTLVATDVEKLGVPDGNGIRHLTVREGLRLFGYPEEYKLELTKKEAFDLLGNTVAVPVVEYVASSLLCSLISLDDESAADYKESVNQSSEMLSRVSV